MASIGWALLLFLALLSLSNRTLLSSSNLTDPPDPFLCHPDQAKALLQLKKSFSFPRSITRLSSWRNGTDCCLWEGVGCDDASGNVTVLDLNNRGFFSPGLNPAVFSLASLQRLDLSMNHFGEDGGIENSGNIPAGFERLTLLTHLNLSNTGLHGQIPLGIGKLQNLLSLDLSNSFEYDYYDQIGASLSSLGSSNYLQESNFSNLVANLKNLRELYLDSVDMSDSGEEWSISLAASVPQLRVLSLSSCGLIGPIHKSLSSISSLTVINLQGNEFSAGPFPEFFMDFLNLTVLQLYRTNLEGRFPTKYFQSKKLRVLDLSANHNLSGHLPNLSNASSLEILRLDGTNFSYAKPTTSRNFNSLKELIVDGNLVSVNFLSSLGSLESLYLCQLDLHGFDSVSEMSSIFSWIGDQKNLTSLELFGCNFSMIIPSLVNNLKTLKNLGMVDCNLPRSIVSAIGNLTELQTLKMRICIIYGSMPSSIGNLKELQTLKITRCTAYGSMPSSIGNLTNLKTLKIHESFFSGTIPYAIGQLKELRWLLLQYCNFSGSIPSSIVNLTQLIILDLSENSLSGEIPSSIFNFPAVRELDLSWNQLSGTIRRFDKAPHSQLVSVDLSNNELSGSIPKAFFQLSQLKYLDLSSNNLIGLVDLNSFSRLSELSSLYLSNNKLNVIDTGGNPLPTDFSGPNELGLASCNMTQFPRSLMRMNCISYLDLSCNKISGDIPKSVWVMWSSSPRYLNLSHNMLTGMQLTSYVLPFTAALDALDLSFNRLQGQIPMPNSSAQVLDYSNNRFSSVLPNWAFYLGYTGYLSMSKNNINGHIPISICNSELDFLDLSLNNFSGPIPSCVIENGRLYVLNLRGNHFEGMLPSNIAAGCSLKMIDLHGNKIEGQIPRGLLNCTYLEVMDLGDNRIADTFPSWLKGLSELSVLILRSNQFYGTIGDIVGDNKTAEYFSSLQIMDLASNNFSGNLSSQWFQWPKSMMLSTLNNTGKIISSQTMSNFGELNQYYIEIMYKGTYMPFERILTTLTVIDLSNNRLEGEIPYSIGNLVGLRVLNMSHNALTGTIPSQLGSMTDLESLDLSCNQLSGEIPQELIGLTSLGSLNLSDNHLVGKIPQSRQFSTFDRSSFEGNAGLCGPPLSKLPCGASPYTLGVAEVNKPFHHVDVVLFLFAGLGFGVGFAAAILVRWNRVGRWFVATAMACRT